VHERLLAHIRQNRLLRAGERVGVAVSGGADSVALLRLLLDIRQELGTPLAVVHFNHKLRAGESDADEAFVRALAKEHGLEFFCEQGDTRAYAAKHGCGIEAAARELRYEFFWRLLSGAAKALDKIATAHTMDDQAETVVLRFARGAGTRGIAGIHPVWNLALGTGLWALGDPNAERPAPKGQSPKPAIVRPLLEFRRAQLRHFLRRASQPWREDASNQDVAFARNRVRQEVMPKLRALNPAIEQVLSETAEIARAEEEYWQEQVRARMPEVVTSSGEGARRTAIDTEKLLRLPLALQRRLVREFAEGQGLRLEFHHVRQVLEVAAEAITRREKRVELPDDWDACLTGSELRLEKRRDRKQHHDYAFPLPLPGEVPIPAAAVRIAAKLADSGPRLKSRELIVRNWRPGDRYWPAHTGSPKKIKELLQDRRIPAKARADWPVVVAGDEIVWVAGFDYPEHAMATSGPGVVLEIVSGIGNRD
jgi:tRNA(Ile)-lysidine synthase